MKSEGQILEIRSKSEESLKRDPSTLTHGDIIGDVLKRSGALAAGEVALRLSFEINLHKGN